MSKMSENSQKPALRFKGFTEAWEQHKLNSIVEYVSSSLMKGDNGVKVKY
jgi:hypothetical protein